MDFLIGLTLLTPKGADAVIGGLVRRGYQVALAQTEPMGQFLTLRVSNDTSSEDEDEEDEEDEEYPEGYGPEVLEGIHAAFKEILSETQTKYFSYVIFAGVVAAVWGDGNLKLVPDPPKGKTVFDHLED